MFLFLIFARVDHLIDSDMLSIMSLFLICAPVDHLIDSDMLSIFFT